MRITFRKEPVEPPPGYVTQAFAIHGMHCNSCAMSIDWEVELLDGVADADTSYADARLTVVFDPARLTPADVVAAAGRAGFRAEPLA